MSRLPGLDPPDAFHCPYRTQCFQREAFRWLATILVAAIVGWIAGCNGKVSLKGWPPGMNFQANWTEETPPAPPPRPVVTSQPS